MSFKTTAILVVLVVAVGAGWAAFSWLRPDAHNEPPGILVADIKKALAEDKTDKAAHILVEYPGQKVELDRKAGATVWTMPGNWPTRTAEVKDLLALLAGLESRFVPIALTDKTEADYGLAKPAVKVTVKVGDETQVLELGQRSASAARKTGGAEDADNAFYQPTFLRLDGRDQAIRLAPGLVEQLRHGADYYQQRWLFIPPGKQIRGDDTPSDATGRQVVVKSIRLTRRKDAPVKGYALTWSGGSWMLSAPVEDRVDPDKVKAILEVVPDIWVEKFVDKPKKDLAEYGLKEPEAELSVTRADGTAVTVLIGKESHVETRMEMPPRPQFPTPQPPQPKIIREEYHFAMLKESKQALSQIFEIKATRLNKDLLVLPDTLRDSRLARFESRNARKVEVSWEGKKILFTKDGFTWKLGEGGASTQQEADESKITELLDKLAGLEAKDLDVIDGADPKSYGLAPPAGTIAVTVEEETKGDAKTKKTKVFHFKVGKDDAAKKKLYVKVDDLKRINAVDDALLKLVARPALAYRGRKVLSVASADVSTLEVHQPKDAYTLEKVKGAWRLKAPVQADVEAFQVDRLADDLTQLEAIEFVVDSAKADDLEKLYGLGKSALTARLTFTDAKKKPETVLVGKQRPGKQDYYARLESAPGIFAVKKEIHDALEKSSLSYRPLDLWKLQPDEIAEVRVLKQEPEYRLKHEGMEWKVTAPFEAAAVTAEVKPLIDDLAGLRAERYEAHFAKGLEVYGLAKPYLRVTVTPAPKKADEKKDDKKDEKKPEKKETKERVLLVGKPVDKGKGRFAKLGDSEVIFVLTEKTVAGLDHGPLDFLDRKLLSLDEKTIQIIRRTGADPMPLTLELKKEVWQVTESPAGPLPTDRAAADKLVRLWTGLRARTIAAYKPKDEELAKLGLKTPSATITVTTSTADKKGKQHVVALGGAVPGAKGERYARVDNGPTIAVLDAATVRILTEGYLDFVDRSALKLDAAAITALERRAGIEVFEISRRQGGWRIVKPAVHPADKPTLDRLVEQLAALRAKGVAAYPAADLKKYGLDKPTVITIRLTGADKKPAEHVLKIGAINEAPEAKGSGERFALVDKSQAVLILPGDLARELTGTPLFFRDRALPALTGADRVIEKRKGRAAVFAKTDDMWKMTGPVEADAEQAALEDFLKALAAARADEVIADKPADLKPYGLDKPEAVWQFSKGGKEVLALTIGAPAKAGKAPGMRRYARMTGSELVFLLDAGLTAKALGEYRSRKVWDAPDAAQVEKVRFGYKDKPFTLVKVGNDWHVEGMEKVKIKGDVVRETLAALADLKADHYVADKAADLELYGLKPAQMELEVTSPTGKKVLYVGRAEGGSRRFYARAADDDKAPVFAIAEADASRLVRQLQDFLEKGSK